MKRLLLTLSCTRVVQNVFDITKQKNMILEISFIFQHNFGPVSYTHLDVYKRQLQNCWTLDLEKEDRVVGGIDWTLKRLSFLMNVGICCKYRQRVAP